MPANTVTVTTMMINLGLSKDSDRGSSAMQSSLLTGQFLHDNISHSVSNADNIMSLYNSSRDNGLVTPRLHLAYTITMLG